MNKKVIAVIGATGGQGGSVARAILSDVNKEFQLRAITRNTTSSKAQELVQDGGEVVSAHLEDVDSLRKAFDGAYGVFCVTALGEDYSPEKEKAQVKNVAQAAKDAKVQHVIWSTLEDTRKWVPLSDNRMPTLLEKYKVPHFDAKAEADQYFKDFDVPTTFLQTTYFWENLTYPGMGPTKNQNGELAITLPMGKAKLAGIAKEDIGKCALAIFKQSGDFVGKTVSIAGDHLTCQEMADALTKSLGQKIIYNEIPPEVFRSFGFPMAEELGNMFQFYRDFTEDFCGRRNLEAVKKLNPSLQSFNDWLSKNAKKIPV